MEEMNIQLEVGKKQAATLKAHLAEVKDREKDGDNRHLEHMKAREKVLEDKEVKSSKKYKWCIYIANSKHLHFIEVVMTRSVLGM